MSINFFNYNTMTEWDFRYIKSTVMFDEKIDKQIRKSLYCNLTYLQLLLCLLQRKTFSVNVTHWISFESYHKISRDLDFYIPPRIISCFIWENIYSLISLIKYHNILLVQSSLNNFILGHCYFKSMDILGV